MRGGEWIGIGTIGGNGTTSSGRDEDGWMNGQMIGAGPTGGGGVIAGADDGSSGMMVVGPPAPPEGLGLDMNMGDDDLLLIVLLRPLRRA